MHWLSHLTSNSPVAHAIGILSLVCVAGMALGSLKVRGVGLVTAGLDTIVAQARQIVDNAVASSAPGARGGKGVQ